MGPMRRFRHALFLLGCAKTDDHPDLHTPEFDLDEDVLLNAVDIFEALVAASG